MLRSVKNLLASRLRAKIIGGYLLIILLMNVVCWLAYRQLHSLNKEVEHLTQDVAREVRISDRIVFQTLSMRSSVDSFLAFQKEEDDNRASEHIKNLRLLLHDAEREINEDKTREDLKEIAGLIEEYVNKYKNAALRLQSRNENVVKLKAEGVTVSKRITEFAKSVMGNKKAASMCVDLFYRISEIQEKIDQFLFVPEAGGRDEAFSLFDKITSQQIPDLHSLLKEKKDREFAPALESLAEAIEDYFDTFSGISSIILKLDSEIKQTLGPYAPQIVSVADRIAQRGWKDMERANIDVDNSVHATSTVIFLLCISATCIGFLTGMLISGRISRPINLLESSATRLAGGDLSQSVQVSSVDEVGTLARAFEKMRLSLKEMIENLETKVEERTAELKEANQAISKSNEDLKTAQEELSNFNRELERKVREQVGVLQKSDLLKRYLAPQLVNQIMKGEKDVSIQHERRKLTIFFSDIKGFTQITDSMEAEELSELLNEYLLEMGQIAFEFGGTIDKFIGDAIMIFFGAPEPSPHKESARKCVLMALSMRERMKTLRVKWVDRGIEFPLEIRIGINTGYATVGNFGSDSRMDYTAIGGQVNLASRLESSSQPGEITLSHSTYAFVKDIVDCEYTGTINVKGIFHPVMTYKVLGLKGQEKD
ncbi:MAG: HAMP domain-containing protein [Nitrospinae bacterium]|nr:HAMP domain-containing protein [Nitrospinota bacterium]